MFAQPVLIEKIFSYTRNHGLVWLQETKLVNKQFRRAIKRAIVRFSFRIYFNPWNLDRLSPILGRKVISMRQIIHVAGMSSGVVLNSKDIIKADSKYFDYNIVVEPVNFYGWYIVKKMLPSLFLLITVLSMHSIVSIRNGLA